MRLLFVCCVGFLVLLAGCNSHPAATAANQQPAPPVAAAPPAPTDTTDYTRTPPGYRTLHADTLIRLGSRRYWLQTRTVTDSTRPFDYGPTAIVGRHFAAPTDSAWRLRRVRGYDGTYTLTLRDSTRRRVVFTRQLHKQDLRHACPPELLTVSEPDFYYQGYSRGLHALLFTVETGIPSSDVIHRAALLLDARTGRTLALQDIGSASFEATDCDPQVSPDGQAVLTCADTLLRAGHPPLSLRRPHAELRAARFLTDTTLLLVYAFGEYRPTKAAAADTVADQAPSSDDPRITADFYVPDEEFVSTPAQKRAANAFIYGTSGRVLSKFRYDGWAPGMGDELPRCWLAATRTHYLVSEGKDLVLLPRAHPGTFQKLPIKGLPRFHPPQRPQEARFSLYSDAGEYTFYIDKTNPQAIRYQLKPVQ